MSSFGGPSQSTLFCLLGDGSSVPALGCEALPCGINSSSRGRLLPAGLLGPISGGCCPAFEARLFGGGFGFGAAFLGGDLGVRGELAGMVGGVGAAGIGV